MANTRPLIEYLPGVLRDVREYQALTQGEETEITLLWDGMQKALSDQFVITATEYGIKRWEAMLDIIPKATLTLDERKATILTRLAEQLPFTVRRLEQQLEAICGKNKFSLNVDNDKYTIEIILNNLSHSVYFDVYAMIHRIKPANMFFGMTAQHDLPVVYIDIYNRKGKVASMRKVVLDWDLFFQSATEAQIGITPVIQVYQRTVIN